MSELGRWILVVVLLGCLVGLVVWARGLDHHHGDDVGAFGNTAAVVGGTR